MPTNRPHLSCPSCGSENSQKLSLAVHAGTSTSTTTTAIIGGASGHFGQGLALSGGTTTSQLAKTHAEPKKKPVFLPLFLVLPVAGVLALIHWIAGAAVLLPFVVKSWLNLSYNQDVQPKLHAEWSAKFICLRCGNIFKPAKR